MSILIIVTCKQETIHRGIVLLDLRQDTGYRRSTSFVARLVLKIGAGNDDRGRNTAAAVCVICFRSVGVNKIDYADFLFNRFLLCRF